MLEIVSKGFANAKAALTGRTTLTAENVDEAVRAIRVSLLEADVALDVVRGFLARVKEQAIGEVVTTQVQVDGKKRRSAPADHFVRICHRELLQLMGPTLATPIVYRRPVTVVMLVGLQGVGKTTTAGKLAKFLLADGRRPLLVGADIYRPAAQEQLRILGQKMQVPVFAPSEVAPRDMAQRALAEAKQQKCDVVVLDTAGRLAIDDALMAELDQVKAATQPHEILLVVDAMAGQDSLRTAQTFDARLNLTGLVMTKLDGDARGGAALSMKQVLNKPIKFLGMGEGLDKLERFRPEGLASRILGMGDLVGLMQDFEQVVDEKKAEQDAKKLLRGQFTLDDFLVQLGHLQKLGPIKDVVAKMPMMGAQAAQVDDKTFVIMRSIIQSMTPEERRDPSLMQAARIRRVARGAGRQEKDVQGLLQRFQMMQAMMAQLRAQPGGLMGMMSGLKKMAKGGLPKGLPNGMPGLPGGLGGNNGDLAAGLPKGLGERLRAMTRGAGPAQPGLPGLPSLGGQAQEADASSAAMGWPAGGGTHAGGRPALAGKQRQKVKDKRKAAKQARKKGRR